MADGDLMDDRRAVDGVSKTTPMDDLDGADVVGGTVGPGGVVGALCNSRRRTWAPTLHKSVSEGTTADRNDCRGACTNGEPPDGVGMGGAQRRRRRGFGVKRDSTTADNRASGWHLWKPRMFRTFLSETHNMADDMVSRTTETDTDGPAYANITVSTEFRDKLRVAKAKRGLTYEQYLRQHVPLETED